ncbi:sugar transferase [Falsiroseomonas ponticola]|uniref:sugar transferase n=1 Tax=Falsiroseomonas ponticola TaxID=2786951 RepID=UPI0019333570|nr:sugar transferase [Roseomonas ponticola]
MHERFGKRALDLVVAALLLVLLSPLFAAVALAVRWRLGSPILFTQPRAGLHGAAFDLKKFRSMAVGPGSDAERLDGFGRALRASGLDELPQLVNVLRGEMSLVGPRPLPLDYGRLYSARQALRLRVRPGLLGPGVAAGRNAVPWERRLELDAAYAAAPLRLRTDLVLALRSLAVWLRGQGTTAPGHATMPAFEPGDRADR